MLPNGLLLDIIMSSGYLNLPIELIIRIYFFLEPEEIITAAQVHLSPSKTIFASHKL